MRRGTPHELSGGDVPRVGHRHPRCAAVRDQHPLNWPSENVAVMSGKLAFTIWYVPETFVNGSRLHSSNHCGYKE